MHHMLLYTQTLSPHSRHTHASDSIGLPLRCTGLCVAQGQRPGAELARTRLSMPRMPRQRYSYDSAIAMTMLRALQLEKRRPRQRYSYDHRDPCDNCDGHRGLDAARTIRAEGLVLFGVGGPRCAGGLRRVYHPAL